LEKLLVVIMVVPGLFLVVEGFDDLGRNVVEKLEVLG
jgi:hypothetical protein|tara:strand:+ start:421 stop:531 length:111 start_codon:yes stop_codon:yes gene_type:complete